MVGGSTGWETQGHIVYLCWASVSSTVKYSAASNDFVIFRPRYPLDGSCCHHHPTPVEWVPWFSNWVPRNFPGAWEETGWGPWISSLLQSDLPVGLLWRTHSSRRAPGATIRWAVTVIQAPPEGLGVLGGWQGRGGGGSERQQLPGLPDQLMKTWIPSAQTIPFTPSCREPPEEPVHGTWAHVSTNMQPQS